MYRYWTYTLGYIDIIGLVLKYEYEDRDNGTFSKIGGEERNRPHSVAWVDGNNRERTGIIVITTKK